MQLTNKMRHKVYDVFYSLNSHQTSVKSYQPTLRHLPKEQSPELINHLELSTLIHDRSCKHVKALKLQVSEDGSVDEVTGKDLGTRCSTVGRDMCFPFLPRHSLTLCCLTSLKSRLLPAVSTA